MNTITQKIVAITFGAVVVFFLLSNGGELIKPAVGSDSVANNWLWIVPTLLIFGLGFLLAALMFSPKKDDNAPPDPESKASLTPGSEGFLERRQNSLPTKEMRLH